MKKILVLVVAYNAEKTISTLLDRFDKKTLDRVDEILIADDASKDNTSKVAEWYKKAKKLDKMRIVHHEKNKGYGGNQKWGYDYAIKKGFDIVVMIHGDAQYPPEYILPLVKPIELGEADFVFGSRMAGNPIKGGMPLYKYLGNIFLTTVENIALGTRLTEFHSGFRAYNVHKLKKIPLNLDSDGFHFDSEIIIQLVLAKGKIREITIPTFYGDEKCNVKVVQYGLNILKELLKLYLHRFKIRRYAKYNIK
jgi:glycosyltransferase involved in cell wall biosynthesis